MLTTYVLFSWGGNHRINNFDISYKKENSIQVLFFNEKFYNMKNKGKITRKNTPTKFEIAKKKKMQCFVSFFSSLFFFPFSFLSSF